MKEIIKISTVTVTWKGEKAGLLPIGEAVEREGGKGGSLFTMKTKDLKRKCVDNWVPVGGM